MLTVVVVVLCVNSSVKQANGNNTIISSRDSQLFIYFALQAQQSVTTRYHHVICTPKLQLYNTHTILYYTIITQRWIRTHVTKTPHAHIHTPLNIIRYSKSRERCNQSNTYTHKHLHTSVRENIYYILRINEVVFFVNGQTDETSLLLTQYHIKCAVSHTWCEDNEGLSLVSEMY